MHRPTASPSSMATLLSVLVLLGLSLVQAHSWVDCTNMLPNGKCAGFPIGYPTRANPDINTLYTYLVSGRPPTAAVCQPGRQDIFPGKNPASLPPASITAGETLHLTWEANGHMNHVTKPSDKRTKASVYWTGVPNKLLHTRSELTSKHLLKTMDFATPQVCDDPANPNTVCHGYVKVPKGTPAGKYQMVWWWRFDQNPVGEEYSTCFEVDVKAPKPVKPTATKSVKPTTKSAKPTATKAPKRR
ncbi:hypothetical protein BGZ99_001953 [Dissophora globulifera]|uniref:DUF7492 domain-containing protein n=1 Tax=Dissophora globulifera TaxID=979702 RepID=A0A9P6RNB1_9FUNG|nr:hypothetical protein BGZ99_001953 [Dissophora globulifera]